MEELRQRVEGAVLTDGAAVETLLHSRLYNLASPVPRPAGVVQVAGTRDVAQVLAFARASNGLSVSVLGGGQNPSRNSVSGNLVLDMALLNHVLVREDEDTVVVGAGATFAHLDAELDFRGRMTVGPTLGRISVAGCALGGGWGLLTKAKGIISDQVVSIDVVTADSRALTLDAKCDDKELFWALTRGGGAGTLCVVTSLTLRTYPKTIVYDGTLSFPLSAARPIVEAILHQKEKWPEEFLAYPLVDKKGFHLKVFCLGSETIAKPYIDALLHASASANVCVSDAREKSYLEAQGSFSDFINRPDSDGSIFSRGHFIQQLTVDSVELCIQRITSFDDDGEIKVIFQNYWSDGGYNLLVWGKGSASVKEYGEKILQDITADSAYMGSAPNFVGDKTVLSELFDRRDEKRMRRVKEKYDPDNVFRNSSIQFQ